MAGVQVALDLFPFGLRQRGDLVVQVGHAVVDIDTQFLKQLGVFCKGFLVENPHAVAKHDRVRDFHHGRLDVQGEHHAGLAGIFELLFIKLAQGLFAHEHAVNDFAGQQLGQGFEHRGLAAFAHQFHAHITRLVQRHGLFTVVEVTLGHVRHVGT